MGVGAVQSYPRHSALGENLIDFDFTHSIDHHERLSLYRQRQLTINVDTIDTRQECDHEHEHEHERERERG